MYKLPNFILLTILCLSYSASYAQDSATYVSPFTLGFGAGTYLSTHSTAGYYNGRAGGRLNAVLTLQEREIRDELGTSDFELEQYAQDMKYKMAGYFELQLGLNLSEKWGAKINFLNVQLDANGIFTLIVQEANPSNSVDPVRESIQIRGKEKRSHIELGVYRNLKLPKPFISQVEAGYSMAFVETKENIFKVGTRDFSIPQTSDVRDPGKDITTFGSGFYGLIRGGLQLPADYKVLLQFRYTNTSIDLNKVVSDNGSILTASIILSKRF